MDFSKFSADQFDAKMWINETFGHGEAKVNRQQYAKTLVTKLELFIQDVNKSLDETSQAAVQMMPKVLREIEAIQQETAILQSKMNDVVHDVQKLEEESCVATDSLLKIDMAKTKMQEVERSLKEMDNWSTLKSVDEVFASGDPDAIASRLIAMQQCLTVIGKKVPDYKERCDYLEQLKDQFVAIVSPSIVTALSSHASDASKHFVRIFTEIDRLEELKSYYRKWLKSDVQRSWKLVVDSGADIDLSEVFSTFFDNLISFWHNQDKWCSTIFNNPEGLTLQGISEGLSGLDPKATTYIESRLDDYEDKLLVLEGLKQMFDSFALKLLTQQGPEGHIQTTTSFNPSSRAFLMALYEPLVPFVTHFQQYQQSQWLAKLNKYDLIVNDSEEFLTAIKSSVEEIDLISHQALSHCESLTDLYATPYLIKALQVFFKNYITKLQKGLEHFRSRLDTHQEDWEEFELSLRIVQCSGQLFVAFQELDTNLQMAVGKLRRNLSLNFQLSDTKVAETPKRSITSEGFEHAVLSNNSIKSDLKHLLMKVPDEFATVLPSVRNRLCNFNEAVHQCTLDILLTPLLKMMGEVSHMEIWHSAQVGDSVATQQLPSFSLSPLEYVTKVGQYLMSCAHHLEPFLLDAFISTALKNFQLPFTEKLEVLTPEEAVQTWIRCSCSATMNYYGEAILAIPELLPAPAKQLSVDIGYVCNVVEDLGVDVLPLLSNIKKLLEEPSIEQSEKWSQIVKELRRL